MAQEELAAYSNIEKKQVYWIESEEHSPTISTLVAIAGGSIFSGIMLLPGVGKALVVHLRCMRKAAMKQVWSMETIGVR